VAGAGQDEHRARCAFCAVADQVEELDRVHIGQLEVQQRQVGQLLARDPDALGAGVGDQHLVAGPLEDACRQVCQFRVVLDHKDPRPRRPHAAEGTPFKWI